MIQEKSIPLDLEKIREKFFLHSAKKGKFTKATQRFLIFMQEVLVYLQKKKLLKDM